MYSNLQPYMEHNLIPKDKEEMSNSSEEKKEKPEEKPSPAEENPSYEYELIGVTVHTGTADGGHYYAFIRDRFVISFSLPFVSFNINLAKFGI